MRMIRHSALLLAVVAGACAHDDVVNTVSRDGTDQIPAITLTRSSPTLPGGTRTTNRFLLVIDTSIADAFGRSTATPANFRPTLDGCYDPVAYAAGPGVVTTFTPQRRLLPAFRSTTSATTFARAYSPYAAPFTNAITYIAAGDNSCNGLSAWEFWYELDRLVASTRYVWGLARYAVDQRGQLDWSEMGIGATVTQPDSLYFRATDFNPAGRKGSPGYRSCGSVNMAHPVNGANPWLLGSAVSAANGTLSLDQTVCDTNGVWADVFGQPNSPVPANNATALGPNQYNFIVVWEALADSTPNYARPVFREQIGPALNAAGAVMNNAFAPFPLPAPPPVAAAAVADTVRVTATNLVPLNSGVYQFWLARAGTDSAVRINVGRIVRLAGAVVVDTLNNVNEFSLTGTMTSARVEFSYANYTPAAWNAVVVAIGTAGETTVGPRQVLWNRLVTKKNAGEAVPSLTSNNVFGTFDHGRNTLQFGAQGSGIGGIFGTELREDIVRLVRPPVGYEYEAWLINTGDATKVYRLGSLLTPYPDLQPLPDADTRTTAPLSGAELTRSAIRLVAPSPTFYCDYNRVQVRLALRNNQGPLPPLTILSTANVTFPGC